MNSEGLPVEVSTRICGVSTSGFYDWKRRAPSQRAIRHAWLTDQIIEVHAASRGTYGSRRVHAEFTLGRGVSVGYHAITMLMQRAGIQGLPGSRRRRKAPGGPTALDLVERNFARPNPDQLWVTDIERYEALSNLAVVKRTPPPVRRSGRVEAEGSLNRGTPGRAEAALTTTGRASTVRWSGSG